MRVILALLFAAPIALSIALQNGAQQVTPLIMVMSAIAIAAYYLFERKAKG